MQPEIQPNRPKENPLAALLKSLWHALSRRPVTKLSAFMIAGIFWAVVIASDPALTIEKTVTGTVTVQGAEALRNRGFIVMDNLAAEPITVRMRVKVKQADYERATAESFSPRLDLSQITGAGSQAVKLTAAYSNLGEVLSFEPEFLTLTVDEYMPPTRVPVVVELTGESAEPLWFSQPTADPPQVYVSGPKSIVERVTRAMVALPLSSLSADRPTDSLSAPITLMDAANEPIESAILQTTNESVPIRSARVDVTVYPTREVPVDTATLYTGVPAHGYAVGGVRVTPGTVMVAARPDVLDALDVVHIVSPVDVSGLTETQVVTSGLRGLSSAAHVSAGEVVVEVEIIPAIHTHTYLDLPVTVMGLSPGLGAKLERDSMSAVISGDYQDVEPLVAGNIHLYVDASQLQAGVHIVPVFCRIDGAPPFACELEQTELTLTLSPVAGP